MPELVFPNKLYYKEAFFLRFTAYDFATNLDGFSKISDIDNIKTMKDDLKQTVKEKGIIDGAGSMLKQLGGDLSSPETNKTPQFRCYLPISSAIKEDLKLQWKKAENIMTGEYNSEFLRTQVETLQTVVSGLLGAWGSFGAPIKRALSSENLSVASKRYIYPNYGYMFEGVGHRNFNFDYKLVPSNQEEASNIIKIVNGIKYFSLPGEDSMGGINTILKYPAFWTIEIMALEKVKTKESETEILRIKENVSRIVKLINFSDLVLDNLSITYGKDGEGEFYYYKDGMPSEINIRMSFTEMKFLTRRTSGITPEEVINHPDNKSLYSVNNTKIGGINTR